MLALNVAYFPYFGMTHNICGLIPHLVKKNTLFVAHYNISARCAPCLPNVENWKVYDW